MNDKLDGDSIGTPFEIVRETRAGRIFWAITTYRKTVLLLSFLVMASAAYFIPALTRDTRAEAFIAADHPAVVYRDKVKEIFGLADPVVIAIVNDGPQGVFNPQTLELVTWLTEEAMNLPGVDPDRVTSLATEKDIFGTEDGMMVEPFFEYPPETQEECDVVRAKVEDFPLYRGTLVARDGTATLVIAELLAAESGATNYQAFLDLVARAPIKNGEVLHVAGEGAVSEFLGAYIDRDAKRLNPISALLITFILIIAFRTWRGMILPNVVVLGALAFTMGSMAAAGVPLYVITNSLPVIIIAISVADAIHILSTYYEEMAFYPDESSQQLTVRAMVHMWRPVTFTSLTDVAGFMGLSIASFMPPMRFYGYFASVGVFAALFFSLFTIPALLVLLKPKQSGPFLRLAAHPGSHIGDGFSRAMGAIGLWVAARPRGVITVAVLLVIAGAFGASQVQVNEERMNVFKETEAIHIADRAMNEKFDGTNYLDVIVETPEIEGLFNPEYLKRIEALQLHMESLPNINGTTSIVDYLKQMNRSINEDRPEAYVLPEDANLIAQYFLLYSASSEPTDFEEEIDYDYRMANVRGHMPLGRYQSLKPDIIEMQRYLKEEFETEGLTAHLAGGGNLDYNWIKDLAPSHFKGVALALLGVWIMASISFRSMLAGLMSTLPVCMALLAIYAVMGTLDIWLGIGTTMFAAIAIGISVDFAIHTMDRIIALVRDEGRDLDDALKMLYPSTGRALFFTFLCMVIGFGVLMTSEVPPLNRFGMLVAIAVTISFVSSMTVLPALVKLTRPAFLKLDARPEDENDSIEPKVRAVG